MDKGIGPGIKVHKSRQHFFIIIASLFYTGFIPLAPGTCGTLLALLFFMFFKIEGILFIVFFIGISFLGVYVSDRAEDILKERDSRHIVIDEFTGYMVSIAGIPADMKNLFIAFFLFRLFDIIKPFPIRSVERRFKGGLSIMLDDIIAGIYSNIVLRLLFLHNFS
ncbi:MAG: phosphatidylglycerophosphatase A [Thermodesulfovibrionales bacterium]|nr:phosphatidylglycerophosphatase A [Thermodesulfovibrionales bacterium]